MASEEAPKLAALPSQPRGDNVTPLPEVDRDMIEALERLLVEARKGELLGCVILAEYEDHGMAVNAGAVSPEVAAWSYKCWEWDMLSQY